MSASSQPAVFNHRLLETGRDVLWLALVFGAVVIFYRVAAPKQWPHAAKTAVVVLPVLAAFRAAGRYAKDEMFPLLLCGQAVITGFAALLLVAVPHRLLASESDTPFGKFGKLGSVHPTLSGVLEGVGVAAVCLLFVLALLSVYVELAGGGKHWEHFAAQCPSAAGFIRNLLWEGTVSLILWLALCEFVWRLTA
jgi:hypothetical protein